MQTWADDSEEPLEVVWYRLDDDAPFFEGINRFMSRNYIGSRRDNAENFTPGEQNLVECENSRSFRLPWYRGNQPAPYRGVTVCGDPLVWQWGGNAVVGGVPITPNTPAIQTRPDGTAACCEPLFLIGLGGQAEGSRPGGPKVAVKVANKVAPQLAAANFSAVLAQVIPLSGPPVAVHYSDPDSLSPAGSWEIGGAGGAGGWFRGDNTKLYFPHDGYYRVGIDLIIYHPLQNISCVGNVYLSVNGGTGIAPLRDLHLNTFGASILLQFRDSFMMKRSAGDYVQLFAEQGSGVDCLAADGGGGALSAEMIAPLSVIPGATGLCTSNLLIRVDAPVIQVAHTVNETVCLNPNDTSMDCGGGGAWAFADGGAMSLECPGGGGSDSVEGAGEPMDLPAGGGYDTVDASGRFMSCPGGGGSSNRDTLGGAMRCPGGGGYEGA